MRVALLFLARTHMQKTILLTVLFLLSLVAPSAAAPGARLGIDVRGRLLPAKVVGLPFHKSGTCRRKENET